MLSLFLDLLFNVILPFPSTVTEDEISNNISSLKKTEWFQDYLQDNKYKQFIIHDREVRSAIGTFHSTRLKKNPYRKKYQRKIDRILRKKK